MMFQHQIKSCEFQVNHTFPILVLRYKENKELYRGRKYESIYWDNKASLVIKETEPSDSAKYRLEVVNALGRAETSGQLTVYSEYRPQLFSFQTSIDIYRSDSRFAPSQ